MNTPTLTFFNYKSGVGKTFLVYHLGWMFAEQGYRVLLMDLDPQSNLTAAFMDEGALAELWRNPSPVTNLSSALKFMVTGAECPTVASRKIDEQLHLIPGDVALAAFEGILAEAWFRCSEEAEGHAGIVLSAFWQIAQKVAHKVEADLILVDVGPNLGAINRAALIASDFVVVPMGSDLLSLRALDQLGPTLNSWRADWQKCRTSLEGRGILLPGGAMNPVGYTTRQPDLKLEVPITAHDVWLNLIPKTYHEQILSDQSHAIKPKEDLDCLAVLRHYRSLRLLSEEVRKPVFHLSPADGAIGAHSEATLLAFQDFARLAERLLDKIGLHREAQST